MCSQEGDLCSAESLFSINDQCCHHQLRFITCTPNAPRTPAGAYPRHQGTGSFPLLAAAARNAPLLIDALLEAGAHPRRSRGSDGCTAAHTAASWGALEALAALLRACPALANAANAAGSTPLHEALWRSGTPAARGLECMRLLLAHGADPQRAGPGAAPPLVLAAGQGAERAVRLLLVAGAGDGEGGFDPALHAAVAAGTTTCVRALLEAGADVSADDKARERTDIYSGQPCNERLY